MDEVEQRRTKQPLWAPTVFRAEMPKHRFQMLCGLVLERSMLNLALVLIHMSKFLSQTYLRKSHYTAGHDWMASELPLWDTCSIRDPTL